MKLKKDVVKFIYNEYLIKYCSDDRIIAREYELVWKAVTFYKNSKIWIITMI